MGLDRKTARMGRTDGDDGIGRFEFGANWTEFLEHMGPGRIEAAKTSLLDMLGMSSLEGRTFLDAGSGSGLFSLAARSLGARVVSFDYDPKSVACTQELKRRYFADDGEWEVGRGDVLDKDFLATLGKYDIVYSWGVLHHTGAMWDAMAHVDGLVDTGGRLFISIYNDQAHASRRWLRIKKRYNRGGRIAKALTIGMVRTYFNAKRLGIGIVRHRNPFYLWKQQDARGMSLKHDDIDWVGGYPFEVAKPEQVFDFFRMRGYVLERLFTCGKGHGCNQFVFTKMPAGVSDRDIGHNRYLQNPDTKEVVIQNRKRKYGSLKPLLAGLARQPLPGRAAIRDPDRPSAYPAGNPSP